MAPASKLSAVAWWADVPPGPGPGCGRASTDDISAAIDRLVSRQDATEAELARRHLAAAVNPAPTALSGLSSSWLEGTSARWPPGLLAGALPSAGGLPARVVSPSRLVHDVPPRLGTLIVSVLSADRVDRPHSAQAVLDELRDTGRTADPGLLIAGGKSASLELTQTKR